ncbi:MAG TPA: hypothetical protein VK756_05020 [Solirubrobacteraceae bacterium]|nr:hypothetical protein [Solirubrobacteraceae bacterium]
MRPARTILAVALAAVAFAAGSAQAAHSSGHRRCAIVAGFGIYPLRGGCAIAKSIATAILVHPNPREIHSVSGTQETYKGWNCALNQGALYCQTPSFAPLHAVKKAFEGAECAGSPGCPIIDRAPVAY